MCQLGVQLGIQLTHIEFGTPRFEDYIPSFLLTFKMLSKGPVIILS